MHSLLSLPREIRDQIIENVISYRKAPPKDPAHDDQSRRDAVESGALRRPFITSETYNAFGLLGINAQLRSETQNRIEQLKPTYSLDVMVVDNELWPTWTCCPSRTFGPINEIRVSLRFFSKPKDSYMVHIARTCRAILQGRTWTTKSLHPLAEIFLHVHDVCLHPDSKDVRVIKNLFFDVDTAGCLGAVVSSASSSEPLSDVEMKTLFGKHRSLWNTFRSIQQQVFRETGGAKKPDLVISLKIMIVFFLQEAWEYECTNYNAYLGPLGSAFMSLQDVHLAVDGESLARLISALSLD